MFSRTIAAALMTFGVAQGALAQDLDTVVARVGETDITLGEMLIARMQLPPQYQQIPADALYDGLLNQLIQQELLSASLEDEPTRLRLSIANETRSLRAGEAIEQIAAAAVSEDDLKAAYDEKYANFEGGQEWHAAHILVDTEEDAKAIVEELNGGADFADLAKEKSTGPSGPSGGDLGWFGAGMMVPEFETAVEGLEDGSISEPVKTQFGWHVVKLMETREKAAPDMEEVRAELESELMRKAVDARIATLESSASVTRIEDIDPEVVSKTDLLETK